MTIFHLNKSSFNVIFQDRTYQNKKARKLIHAFLFIFRASENSLSSILYPPICTGVPPPALGFGFSPGVTLALILKTVVAGSVLAVIETVLVC